MKVFNFFAHVFTVLSFLTLGSLLIIVSLHILSIEDAILNIRQIYENPWNSIQTGFVGMLFIMVGLTFAKMIVKKGHEADAVVLQSEMGPIVVSSHAIEDSIRKVLKRFHLVKESKIKTIIQNKDVEIRLRLVLWSGGLLPDLLSEIQEEIYLKLRKLLGDVGKVEITCDVQRIEDHDMDFPEIEKKQPISQISSSF